MRENFDSGSPMNEGMKNKPENEALFEDIQSELLSESPREQQTTETRAMELLSKQEGVANEETEMGEISESAEKGRSFLREKFEAIKGFVGAPLEGDDEYVRQEKWKALRHKLIGAGIALSGAALETYFQLDPGTRQNAEYLRQNFPYHATMSEMGIHAHSITLFLAGTGVYLMSKADLRSKLEELGTAKTEGTYPYVE